MNPALVIIIAIICIAVWFLVSFLYKPIGKWIGTIWRDAIEIMKENDESEEKN